MQVFESFERSADIALQIHAHTRAHAVRRVPVPLSTEQHGGLCKGSAENVRQVMQTCNPGLVYHEGRWTGAAGIVSQEQ